MDIGRRSFLLGAASVAPLCAAPRLHPPQDLWTAGQGGYALYRIPGLLVTRKGAVLAWCEARQSSRGDWGTTDLLLRRSIDGGRTFSAARVLGRLTGPVRKNPIAIEQNLAAPDTVLYNNPLAIAGRGGTVHFLYCLEYMRAFYLRSRDDGQTWSDPVEITAAFDAYRPDYPWRVLAIGPGHGIQLRSGRLLASVWLSTGTGGHGHRPSAASTIYSDDEGATWHAGAIAVPDSPEWPNPSEATVAELSDGRVMLNVRTESTRKRRLVTTSRDGAGGWAAPQFDEALVDPVCFGSLARNGRSLVFVNPDDPLKRQNLTLRVSHDDGRSWSEKHVVDAGRAGYADIAVRGNGDALCLYERGASEALALAAARIAP